MRSRFFGYLFVSVILHLLALLYPFSATRGGLGSQGMLPVRVHLIAAEKTASEKQGVEGSPAETNASEAPARPLSGEIESIADSTAEPETPADRSPASSTAAVTADVGAPLLRADPVRKKAGPPKTAPTRPQPPGARAERAREKRAEKTAALRTTSVYPGTQHKGVARQGAARSPAEQGAAPGSDASASGPEHQANPRETPGDSFSGARYARVVKPKYPEEARVRGWEGTTLLKVLVNPYGKSEEIRVYRSSGFDLLDDAAVDALRRWEFHPARRGPYPVRSWVNVPIVFKLEEDN